jgi:hypothetical protein
MTKKTLLTVAAVSILSGGVVVVTNAFAQTTTSGQQSVPSLAQEIASKFHLNVSDVQSVFDQHQQEVKSQQESTYDAYLQNLVNTGKITEEQQQLILNKHKQLASQMQSNRQKVKSMTPTERKTQMRAAIQDLKNWAKQNNIALQYLRPFGPGRGFGRVGWHQPTTPTPTQ